MSKYAENVHLGFEVGTGKRVSIPVAHLAVTGQTQVSGKTTTLEALITRSKRSAIAFVTKRGEGSFAGDDVRLIPPYFRERADWQFVSDILGAILHEKLKFQRSWIMDVCKAKHSLREVAAEVDLRLDNPRLRSLDKSIFTELHEYFKLLIPEIERQPFSSMLELSHSGLNVMDLSAMTTPLQMLVIASVADLIYKQCKNTIVVIPEAWEFVPQGRSSPVKREVESLIRKGGNLQNFVWMDSQDIAGVEKSVLRQVAVWLLGVQREHNEVKRVLDHIPRSIHKPKVEEVMQLTKGQFFACFGTVTKKVYVQPVWMTDGQALSVATGEVSAFGQELAHRVEMKTKRAIQSVSDHMPAHGPEDDMDQAERQEFVTCIDALKEDNHALRQQVSELSAQVGALRIDPAPIPSSTIALERAGRSRGFTETEVSLLLDRVFADPRIPKGGVVQVEPKEVVLRSYQQAEVDRVIKECESFTPWQRDVLRYVEAKGGRHSKNGIFEAITGKSSSAAGAAYKAKSEEIDQVVSLGFLRTEKGHTYPNLSVGITARLKAFNATPQDVEDVVGQVLLRLKR